MRDVARDRLFALLPQFVRAADERQPLEPLRTLYQVLQLAYDGLEQDIAGLYDDWFVETCADRAVPHIAALVGTELAGVPPLWSHRAQAANTLRWRARPGTLTTFAQAAACASGWPVAALDLATEIAMSAAISPAPGVAAVARIPPTGADGPGNRPPRTVSVGPAPPARSSATGGSYVAPGAVSLSVFTLPVFSMDGVEPARCGGVFAFHSNGLAGPLFNVPEVFAPAMADPGVDELPRPLTRGLVRDMLAMPGQRLPFAIRHRSDTGWVSVPSNRIGVARLDGTKWPARADAEVLVDPERGLFVFVGRDQQPEPSDLRVDYGFGFGGPVGAAARSAAADARPIAPVRRICLAADHKAGADLGRGRPGDWATNLDEALQDWDGTIDLDLRIVDGGCYAAPRTIPELRDGVVLSISASSGARPRLHGPLSARGEKARLILQGLDLPDGVTVQGVSLTVRGCTVGLARPRALHLDCGWTSGRLKIADSIVGPVVCEAARLTAERSIFDSRAAIGAAPKTAVQGNGGACPASVRLDHCTVLGDLRLARRAELGDCAVEGTLYGIDGTRRLRAKFKTRKLNDPYYLQLKSNGRKGVEDGAFGTQERAHRLHALDAAISRHLPQGLACAVVLAS